MLSVRSDSKNSSGKWMKIWVVGVDGRTTTTTTTTRLKLRFCISLLASFSAVSLSFSELLCSHLLLHSYRNVEMQLLSVLSIETN